jgi:hypothetical protein
MALVNVISKELENDLRIAAQQITATAVAAEVLLKHLDEDRATLMRKAERIAKAAQEPA